MKVKDMEDTLAINLKYIYIKLFSPPSQEYFYESTHPRLFLGGDFKKVKEWRGKLIGEEDWVYFLPERVQTNHY